MSTESSPPDSPGIPAQTCAHTARRRLLLACASGVLLVYFLAAYVIMPVAWRVRVHRHPALDQVPGITTTASGIPGDPINVALVGSKSAIIKIMLAAKWYPADPLSLRSCREIAEATVLKREYDDAPVSSLYLWGRKEDLAFEQPVGPDPKQRHHVRFWRSATLDDQGRPMWVGSATFDRRVGLSHTTGQITHHIAEDVDTERDHLLQNLEATGDLSERYAVPGFHKVLEGRNGGGDPWKTDGQLFVGMIEIKNAP